MEKSVVDVTAVWFLSVMAISGGMASGYADFNSRPAGSDNSRLLLISV